MNITFPLADTLGVTAGLLQDGVLLGNLAFNDFVPDFPPQVNPNAFQFKSFQSQFLSFAKYRLKDSAPDPVEWILVTDDMNFAVATTLFQADSVGLYRTKQLYIAIDDTTNGLAFEITTAGVGYTVAAEYSTATGYSPLTTATIPGNFTKVTGRNIMTFTQPTDWIEAFIGTTTPKYKWLRLTFTGTVTTEAIAEGGYLLNSELVDIITGQIENSIFNPYYVTSHAFFPQEGDVMYYSTQYAPVGMRFDVRTPQNGSPLEYEYMRVDGTTNTFVPLIDPSNGLTATNITNFANSTFTATGANAFTSTNEGFDTRGYVECAVANLPTATNNTFSLGLSNVQTGTPLYEIRLLWDGVKAVAQAYESGNQLGVPYDVLSVGSKIRILKYDDGNITYLVDDIAIAGGIQDTNLVLFPMVTIYTSGDTVEQFQLVDWAANLAIPNAITLINDVNITVTPELATDQNYPAIYYMYFSPPADMVSVPANLNPSGQAGYVIGMRQVDNTTTANPVLWNFYSYCANNPSNTFINTGTQTTAKVFTLNTGIYQADIANNTFMLVLQNSVNVQTRLVEVPAPAVDTLTTSADLSSSAGMTGLILVQVSGDDTISVGVPSSLILSS